MTVTSRGKGSRADPFVAALRAWARASGLTALAVWATLPACAPEAPRTVASLHPPATALLTEMGLGSRLLPREDASAAPSPSLVLLPPRGAAPPETPPEATALRVDPVDLDGLFALARRIGAALGAEDVADRWVERTRLDLARVSASSFGSPRPHLAAIVSLDPLAVAGGSSLETELIEIAGAESVTHGGLELRVAIDELPEEHRTPDLWLVMTPTPATTARARLAEALPAGAAVDEFRLPDTWLADPVTVARRLREVVAQIAQQGAAFRIPGADGQP
jgi:hypothetical protein